MKWQMFTILRNMMKCSPKYRNIWANIDWIRAGLMWSNYAGTLAAVMECKQFHFQPIFVAFTIL